MGPERSRPRRGAHGQNRAPPRRRSWPPGRREIIDTPTVDAPVSPSPDPAKARARLERAAPLKRTGEADDAARPAAYPASDASKLHPASDASKLVTGAEFVVDGGLTAR
ncbi:MAG TPA: hypothetical protein VFS00_00395 [Polyangiaceae bacterium]|nr:hypothetical protein [Polyangiaceae bacterium]